MEMMNLGKSPLAVPRLGVGVMTWGEDPKSWFNPAKQAYGGPASAQAEKDAFETSLKSGITLFDSAEMYSYGASESRLGALAEGSKAIVATKFPPGMFSRPDEVPLALEDSLKRLKRTSVDLYQHHFPTSEKGIRKTLPLMADQVDAGRVKAVGVSNYSASQMRLAHKILADRGIPLASNQVQYSLLHRNPETDGVLDACRELGVTLIAYQPLASGALTGKYGTARRPEGLRRIMPYFRKKYLPELDRIIAIMTEIGRGYGKNPAQVALRWLLENPIVLPIPGAKDGRQAEVNAGASGFRLQSEEVEALNQATLKWL